MLGAGLQFNRSRNGDDQFCSVRRSRYYLQRTQSDVTCSRSRRRLVKSPTEKDSTVCGTVLESSPLCNLERFLDSVTPLVPAQYLSKTTMRGLGTCDGDFQLFFVLSDLWESFKEWSAYGAGVPLVLNDSHGVVQYYVPYLSGIQLYADLSKSSAKLRRLGEESDVDYFRDSSSDGSSGSDSDLDKGVLNYSMEQQKFLHASNSPLRVDQRSLKEQQFQEVFTSDEGDSGSLPGYLLYEYLELDQPYCREPLANKIADLALIFPELKTLKSCDLLPSSWISVAWYPIYRIPTGPTLKDLDACFLTFHTLHTPMAGNEAIRPPIVKYPTETDGVAQILLPVFGLASYKYNASLWTPNTGCQHQLSTSLLQAADNWLNLLHVNHPDFSFFCHRQLSR